MVVSELAPTGSRCYRNVTECCLDYAGIVNLFMLMPALGREVGVGPHSRPLCGQCRARDCLPHLESVPHLLTIRRRGKPMPTRTEMLGDGAIGREKPLGVPRGLEPLQASLPLAGGLVGVLGAVVEIPVLAMFDPRQDLALGGSVTLQFVGDDYAGDVDQAFQEFAEELLRSFLIPTTLDQDIQHVPLLIYRPPEIMTLTLDGQKHLIEMPFITGPRTSTT
jgi:hypothetical protein